jgi:hypothetical protein
VRIGGHPRDGRGDHQDCHGATFFSLFSGWVPRSHDPSQREGGIQRVTVAVPGPLILKKPWEALCARLSARRATSLGGFVWVRSPGKATEAHSVTPCAGVLRSGSDPSSNACLLAATETPASTAARRSTRTLAGNAQPPPSSGAPCAVPLRADASASVGSDPSRIARPCARQTSVCIDSRCGLP